MVLTMGSFPQSRYSLPAPLFRIVAVLIAIFAFFIMSKLLFASLGFLGLGGALSSQSTPDTPDWDSILNSGNMGNNMKQNTGNGGKEGQGVIAVPKQDGTSESQTVCLSYASYSSRRHPPFSTGKAQLPYQRPDTDCRKVFIPEVEAAVADMKVHIADPDLFRLFENAFPNTLDTAVSWHGHSKDDAEEELTMISTGDINAMWLRDSANQLQSYKSLLTANDSSDSLASLFRGAINLQARFILAAPHCNAFQPPPESGLPAQPNSWAASDIVSPAFPRDRVFECKYELDSLAAFLQLSHDYYSQTQDVEFFRRFHWTETITKILAVASDLRVGTYNEKDGTVIPSPYTFQRPTTVASETLHNAGAGSPVKAGTGLVRSAFRPSDDSCIYQLFIPANMMFASHLTTNAAIATALGNNTLAGGMTAMAGDIRKGVEEYGKMNHPKYGEIYAYEVDGFGGHIAMDDANIPSLLSAPMLGYLERDDEVYQNTRKFVLGQDNPYYMKGKAINAVGGPHIGPGMAWPMALIVQLLTTDDDAEIIEGLKQLVGSTGGLGLIHESVNSQSGDNWTRSWFSWANGLFGQMILDLKERKPHILQRTFQ